MGVFKEMELQKEIYLLQDRVETLERQLKTEQQVMNQLLEDVMPIVKLYKVLVLRESE